MSDKHLSGSQAQQIVSALAAKANVQFRKAADSYTKTQVDSKIDSAVSAAYKPAGTIAGSALTSELLVAANYRKVYNISSELSISAANENLFIDRSAGDKVYAGDNVGVIEAPESYTAATGTAVDGTQYYSEDGGVYTAVTIGTGESVSGYYTKDETSYLFDVLTGFVSYTEGDAININSNNEVSVNLGSNTNGLSVDNGLQLALATGNGTTYVNASGTYVNGTTYYTDSTGETTVDSSAFEEGVTDVSSYYVAQSVAGSAGAMSAADKAKLDSLGTASSEEVAAIIASIDTAWSNN